MAITSLHSETFWQGLRDLRRHLHAAGEEGWSLQLRTSAEAAAGGDIARTQLPETLRRLRASNACERLEIEFAVDALLEMFELCRN